MSPGRLNDRCGKKLLFLGEAPECCLAPWTRLWRSGVYQYKTVSRQSKYFKIGNCRTAAINLEWIHDSRSRGLQRSNIPRIAANLSTLVKQLKAETWRTQRIAIGIVTRERQLSVTHTSVEDLKVLKTQWKWWLKHVLKALLLWVGRSCSAVCRKWGYFQLISISGLLRWSQNLLAWIQRQIKIAL